VHEVRLATAADGPAISAAMSHAFADDPIWRWLVPSDIRWDKGSPGFFSADFGNRMRLGHVYTIDGGIGAAQWHPPGHWKPTVGDLARQMPSALKLFHGDIVSALKYLARMEKKHPHEPDHWYLAVLGTEPEHQGKGIGSALLQPILERCDLEETPAYLESSKEANIPFYRRHGFEVLCEHPFHAGGPSLWPMWRDPRPPI
jgi:GNAT superfamily N-acetyltransferase